jgi:ABC-type nitrate/sulfonate/bicarbonate transport system substrate-binding protein
VHPGAKCGPPRFPLSGLPFCPCPAKLLDRGSTIHAPAHPPHFPLASAAGDRAARRSRPVLAGCGSSSSSDGGGSSSSSAKIGDATVQLSWIKNSEFAGEFFADSKGYYKDAGISNVTLTPGPTSTENLVASGKATFGLSNSVSTAQAIANEQAPLKIIATTYQKNPFTILSIANKGNIKTPQDMIGKKIGVQASNATLFAALLKANGIDKSKVKIVPVQYDPSVLTDGQVDGFVAYLTNESIIVQDKGFKVTNLPFADNKLPFVAESIIASDDTIKNKPALVKAFLTAEIKGWKDACADPAAGAKLAVDNYGKKLKLELDKETQQAQIQCSDLINTDETKTNGTFTISPTMQDQNIATLKSAGIDITADKLFDTSALDSLLKAKPELKVTG